MRNAMRRRVTGCIFLFSVAAFSQSVVVPIPPGKLDPARDPALLSKAPPDRLREHFIWTAGDAAALDPALQTKVRGQNDKIVPHFFRAHFRLHAIPAEATLYLAGPRSATVFLNGLQVLHFDDDGKREKGFQVSAMAVAQALRVGENVLAIEAVRGHSSLHTGADATINQVTYGEVLLSKIVPRAMGVNGPAMLVSDDSWRSRVGAALGWSAVTFADGTWPAVQALGVAGSRSDFLQWNADAGLYAWPGYTGISSAMRTFHLPVTAVRDISSEARLPHIDSLSHSGGLVVLKGNDASPTAMTLDFGREVNGRIHLVSDTGATVSVETSYGESAAEALQHPYLSVRRILVPPHGEAYGPKSGFRFVRLQFGPDASQWRRIDVQGIAYPVHYAGSFESSDPLLNRIWETAAYTAHLCMQEGIWDAPKRDRGRWMGDLDVTGRVIDSVFADRSQMEATMAQVIGEPPVLRDVNTIAGYSALWITGQANFYRHQGDLAYLRSMHTRLLQLLQLMDGELNNAGLFTNPGKHKVFVDWSAGFSSDTPEARAATQFEFCLAYREALYLLTVLGDNANAEVYRAKAERLRAAAQSYLLDTRTDTFGSRWQTNAMAVVSGAATDDEEKDIWSVVLTHVGDGTSTAVITPYYGFYVLSAMAELDHRKEALAWMRQYWGGMLAEGATSFWEGYDPHWPKQDFHAHLLADGETGFYVSLAHGWSSGPAAWLMQQVLGIEPTAGGFRQVSLRPDLSGLAWARGTEPTPRGLIRMDVRPRRIEISLPPQTTATVSLPVAAGSATLRDNGRPVRMESDEGGTRSVVILHAAGEHIFTWSEVAGS
jgi:alpha-L-rhamnosidase